MPLIASEKAKILIMTNISGWILSKFAENIIRILSDKYDFYYMSDSYAKFRPTKLDYLLDRVNLVINLSQGSIVFINRYLQKNPLRRKNLKVITYIHHFTTWKLEHQLSVDLSDKIVTGTEEWKVRMIKEQGVDSEKIVVVKYGIDFSAYSRISEVSTSRNFRIGFVGSALSNKDGDRKNLNLLFEFIEKLKSKNDYFEFAFLGMGWKPVVKELKGKNTRATNLGFIRDDLLSGFYSQIDLLLVTSSVEGGPYTVLEALACNTVVLTTEVGLVSDTVKSGHNGFIYDPEKLDEAVKFVTELVQDDKYRTSLMNNTRVSINPQRAWMNTLKPLDATISELLADEPIIMKISEHYDVVKNEVELFDAITWIYSSVKNNFIKFSDLPKFFSALTINISFIDMIFALPRIYKKTYASDSKK